MTDVASYLRSDRYDGSLQLLALDPWVLSFKPEDHWFLHSIDIFNTLDRLMKNKSNGRTDNYEVKSRLVNLLEESNTLQRKGAKDSKKFIFIAWCNLYTRWSKRFSSGILL